MTTQTPTWLTQKILAVAVIFLSFGATHDAMAAYTPGKLSLSMILEMATCDVAVATSPTLVFPTLSSTDLAEEAGHVSAGGNQKITLNIRNCPSSAQKAGATPAVKLLGVTDATSNDRIFRDYSSTAVGNIGFGVRYLMPGTENVDTSRGKDGGYLTNGDFIDLASVGKAATDQDVSFFVDVVHKPIGESISSGILKATLNFIITFH
ncbi:fimbrial protein [Serratia marcescens]|uniref:Fimbrial protein n=1 Tax=Serratia marcescens TaxID=615 RepID=A0A5C7BVT2_SERMA|nr:MULTISPECIES: fimbrial protein [Serratia]TXE24855.1 fimbrial protein [Serratia marcescens]TXE53361.1 fimbrial protein [Serratia marcescens]